VPDQPGAGAKGQKSTWKERMASLPEVLWILVIFLLVIGA